VLERRKKAAVAEPRRHAAAVWHPRTASTSSRRRSGTPAPGTPGPRPAARRTRRAAGRGNQVTAAPGAARRSHRPARPAAGRRSGGGQRCEPGAGRDGEAPPASRCRPRSTHGAHDAAGAASRMRCPRPGHVLRRHGRWAWRITALPHPLACLLVVTPRRFSGPLSWGQGPGRSEAHDCRALVRIAHEGNPWCLDLLVRWSQGVVALFRLQVLRREISPSRPGPAAPLGQSSVAGTPGPR
jgi:hypothetical protein